METSNESATSGLIDRRWLMDTLMVIYEKLDSLERNLATTPPEAFCTCHGAAGPGGGLMENLRITRYLDASGEQSCADVRAAVQIRANTTTLMTSLAQMLVDISLPGAVQDVDLVHVARSAEMAMEAFSTNPTGAPADVRSAHMGPTVVGSEGSARTGEPTSSS